MQRRKEEKHRRAEKRDRYKHFHCHGVRLLTGINVKSMSLWLLYASQSLQMFEKAAAMWGAWIIPAVLLVFGLSWSVSQVLRLLPGEACVESMKLSNTLSAFAEPQSRLLRRHIKIQMIQTTIWYSVTATMTVLDEITCMALLRAKKSLAHDDKCWKSRLCQLVWAI